MELQAWRKRNAEGEEFELPSGLVVTLRRVSLLDLAEQGQIPAPLVGAVNAVFDTRVRHLTVEGTGQFVDVVNLLVKAAVLDPPVADQPDEAHLGIEELSLKDRLAIYNWCQVAQELRPFRRAAGEPVAP